MKLHQQPAETAAKPTAQATAQATADAAHDREPVPYPKQELAPTVI